MGRRRRCSGAMRSVTVTACLHEHLGDERHEVLQRLVGMALARLLQEAADRANHVEHPLVALALGEVLFEKGGVDSGVEPGDGVGPHGQLEADRTGLVVVRREELGEKRGSPGRINACACAV